MSKYAYLDVMWGYADPKYSTVLDISGETPSNFGYGGTTQYEQLKKNYDNAKKTAKTVQAKKKNTIGVFTGKLEPPATMPPSEIQRIKDLKCPPPIQPTMVNASVNELNNSIQQQLSTIQLLEKQVEDLEKRYKISFSVNGPPKFDLSATQTPYITASGTPTNIILDFHMWGARDGIQGVRGIQGNQGHRPSYTYGNTGSTGPPGYYGVKGNTYK